jgi:FtsP/CotA-like multicopper oxidase with cupredoxin domain
LPGKRMFHCHILEHEDNCMMAILDVRPANGA